MGFNWEWDDNMLMRFLIEHMLGWHECKKIKKRKKKLGKLVVFVLQ